MIERTKRSENCLVLAGHSVCDSPDRTNLDMLRALVVYAQDPNNGVWLAPVSEVASFIAKEQAAKE